MGKPYVMIPRQKLSDGLPSDRIQSPGKLLARWCRKGDSRNLVRGCSWISLLCLLRRFGVRQCSRLFSGGCRRSCQASSNDAVGRFELPTPCLWLFVVAFCGLQWRALFYLNMLALLYRKALGYMVCFMACHLHKLLYSLSRDEPGNASEIFIEKGLKSPCRNVY
jgi:hypothetical protein